MRPAIPNCSLPLPLPPLPTQLNVGCCAACMAGGGRVEHYQWGERGLWYHNWYRDEFYTNKIVVSSSWLPYCSSPGGTEGPTIWQCHNWRRKTDDYLQSIWQFVCLTTNICMRHIIVIIVISFGIILILVRATMRPMREGERQLSNLSIGRGATAWEKEMKTILN